MRSSGIGGQAVLEGVMMKYKDHYAVAVRKPDGEIEISKNKCKSIADKSVFFRLPIIRGIVAFVESLTLGMGTLTYSAGFYEEDEQKDTKDKNDAKSSKKEAVETGLTVALSIVLAIGVFMVLPFFLSQLLHAKIESTTVLAVIEGVIRIALFVGYVLAISCMKDIKRVFMYHGAEHKSITCVENGLELTVGNVRRQSKHHKRCGTSFMLIVMFVSIIFFMFIHFENVWLRMAVRILLVPVIAGVSYEFIRIAGRSDSKLVAILSKPGILLQRLTTREPEDEMIEVAIASIEGVFDWKKYQKECKEKELQLKRKKKKTTAPKKSRAEIKEELIEREKKNKLRAAEFERRYKEEERQAKELEEIADAAIRRKMNRTDLAEDNTLAGLDHYLNSNMNNRDNG